MPLCLFLSGQKMFYITLFQPSLLRFFDITPLGQILNRFSADTNIIDQVKMDERIN